MPLVPLSCPVTFLKTHGKKKIQIKVNGRVHFLGSTKLWNYESAVSCQIHIDIYKWNQVVDL